MKETYSGVCIGGPYDGNVYQARHNLFCVAIANPVRVGPLQPSYNKPVKHKDYEYRHQKLGGGGIWYGEEFSSPSEALGHVFDVYAATKQRS